MENQPIETTEQTTQTPVESAALNLMLSDEAVTSEQDNFRDIVNRASGVKESGIDAAEAARKSQLASIEGTFGREERNLERNARDARTAFAQGSSMGTSTAQFKLLNDTINQNLGDIKARKEEARLNSDSNYLAQLNQLEADYLLQKQNASQAMFNNIMQIAGLGQQATQFNKQFGLQRQQFEQQERAQQFQQEQAIGSIALQFGLDMQEGESLDSIIDRAAPLVTEQRGLDKKEQELRFEQLRASINQSKASANQIRAAAARQEKVSSMTPEALKQAVQLGLVAPDVAFSTADNPEQRNAVISAQREGLTALAGQSVAQYAQDSSMSRQDIIDTVMAENPGLVSTEIQAMVDDALSVSGSTNKSNGDNLPQILKNMGESGIRARDDLQYFLTGTRQNR